MARWTALFLVMTRENSALRRQAGADDRSVAVGRVAAHQDLPGRPGGPGGGDGLGDHPPGALARAGLARAQPHPGDHRRAAAVLIVVASGDSPLRSTCLPAIFVWP